MLNQDRLRDESGSSAIEFALVAPMVIALLFGTVEVGAMEMMSVNLDAAVTKAARLIRTGNAARAGSGQAFASQICASMSDTAANCTARLAFSVSKFTTFANAAQAAAAVPNGSFDAGGPGDIILIKATYTWPMILPLYGGEFTSSGASRAVLSAGTAFKNEPYQ